MISSVVSMVVMGSRNFLQCWKKLLVLSLVFFILLLLIICCVNRWLRVIGGVRYFSLKVISVIIQKCSGLMLLLNVIWVMVVLIRIIVLQGFMIMLMIIMVIIRMFIVIQIDGNILGSIFSRLECLMMLLVFIDRVISINRVLM